MDIKIRPLRQKGAEVIRVRVERRLKRQGCFKELGKEALPSVLIEGGARLAASALKERAVDKAVFIMAPKIIGGDGWIGVEVSE